MNMLYAFSIILIFLYFQNTFTATAHNLAHFTDDHLSIDCGSSANSKNWIGDVPRKFIQIKGSSTTSTLIHDDDDNPVPYKTTRISVSQFSYSFQLKPGEKLIRLHFNPCRYKGFERFKDLFNVEAGPFTLLDNFSASLTAANSFTKEFYISIEENQTLDIVFTPANGQSLDGKAYAFVNGIEIISVPMRLSYFRGGDYGAQVIGKKSLVHVDNTTALELIHRLNVKKGSVPSGGGFDDMLGLWASVSKENAKEINSLTWKISVHVGFRYMVRIYFYELAKKGESGNVSFKIFINDMIVDTNKNIIKDMDDNGNVWYRDYLVNMKGRKQKSKRDLLISMQSNDDSMDGQNSIKGFEIFKISNLDNSLASPNPLPPENDSPSCNFRKLISVVSHRNAIATVATTIIALVNVIVHKLREIWEASVVEDENKPSARADRFCRRFSLFEIRSATKNFSDALVIGQGGFGKVYQGFIASETEIVAIKRLKSNSKQGKREFWTEVETLSELRHINLVSLIGYCNEREEMIIVYEYVACGTLGDHLYKLARDGYDCSSLTWKQRLNICIGAGRGLDYLHTGHRVIHRDVKASNILVDENFVAKVSDFGLAKAQDRSKLESHVSTKVKGTFGYFDPYYFNTHKLTRKSDTYAFGVVLLEVLCGRPAMDRRAGEDECTLTKWALIRINKGEVDQIVDSSLIGDISPDSLKVFIEVAESCLHDEPKKRPTMAQVVLQLESALEKHESRKLDVQNQMKSVGNGVSPSTDEPISSVTTEKLLVASADVQPVTPLPIGQTNRPTENTRKMDRRKSKAYNLRKIWDWVIPQMRKETSSSSAGELYEVDIKLPKFDLATISAATNHFSSPNLIGQGVFASVYKAVLPTGQLVAVKRFSSLNDFDKEIHLVSKLEHPNIVKLLGYCIDKRWMLLLYEFMENISLDGFIFDEIQGHQLQWAVRFKIIIGVARGVLYLHQVSGLRIIHKDLKPRNILLDIEMNPKISGFGFAKTLRNNQLETDTQIFGTFGYMSPEYALLGRVSEKIDVYSFGVSVLEIVSGKRNMYRESGLCLIEYALKLWSEGKALDLVDESLGGAFTEEEALRCIQVGLLSIQQLVHRPAMSSLLKMLEGEEQLVELQCLEEKI